MSTPDEKIAERIGSEIDLHLSRLRHERAELEKAAARIVEIDAEIAVLQTEKTRIDQRRPKPAPPDDTATDRPPRTPRT